MTKILFGLLYLFTSLVYGDVSLSEQDHQWIRENPVIGYQSNGTWPVDFHRNGQHMGLVRDYLNTIAKLTGLKFVENNLDIPSRGQLPTWLIPVASPTLSSLSPQQWKLTDAYFTVGALVVTQANKPSVYTLRQLEGYTLAIQKTSLYRNWLGKNYPKIKLIAYEDGLQALQAVKKGDAYAAMGAEFSIRPLLQRYFTTTLAIAGYPPEAYTGVHMAISAEQPELHSIINKALMSLSAQETDDIFNRWVEELILGIPPISTVFYYYSGEAVLLLILLLLLAGSLYQARRARMRAEHSEAEKSRFLAVMSHEIRTPMNAVMASLELLQRPGALQKHEYISLARTSAEGLMALLNDILDYSRLESGQLALHVDTMELHSFLKSIYDSHLPGAISKGLTLRMECSMNELWIRADSQRLRQILHNLLSNAIKFSEQGEVVLAADVKNGEGASRILTLSVLDQGPGIPESEQERLFNAWQQVDNSMTRRHGGSGLGLYICQQLATLMGGTLSLTSQAGEGAAVYLALQVECQQPQESTAQDQDIEHTLPQFSETMSVLVVEDHPVNQRLLMDQLEVLGCHCEVAVDGLAALRLIAEENYYSAVLLDCNLPDMSGYVVSKKIRAFESRMQREPMPIIAISAMSDSAHVVRVRESGMDDVLFKPIRLKMLADTLSRWCQYEIVSPQSASQTVAVSAREREFLEEDLKGLSMAMTLEDMPQMRHYSHRIKGVALILGLTRLASLATALEERLIQGEPMSIEEGEEWQKKLKEQIVQSSTSEVPHV